MKESPPKGFKQYRILLASVPWGEAPPNRSSASDFKLKDVEIPFHILGPGAHSPFPGPLLCALFPLFQIFPFCQLPAYYQCIFPIHISYTRRENKKSSVLIFLSLLLCSGLSRLRVECYPQRIVEKGLRERSDKAPPRNRNEQKPQGMACKNETGARKKRGTTH